MKKIFRIFSFILKHPLAKRNKTKSIIRFIKWQVISRIVHFPIIYPYVEKSKIIAQKGMGSNGTIYVGLNDFEDMSFLLHFLREDDLFVDVGANIGLYTVLSSAVIGAKTVCFEPVKTTFQKLLLNINVNNIHHKVEACNMGLGDKTMNLKFSVNLDSMNHVIMPNEIETDLFQEAQVDRMDNIFKTRIPLLLKIDVEGYELQVLKGAAKTLQNPELRAIIVELNAGGWRFNVPDDMIHNYLSEFGFRPYSYNPFTREIRQEQTYSKGLNTIYLRDIPFIKERIQNQRKIEINSIYI